MWPLRQSFSALVACGRFPRALASGVGGFLAIAILAVTAAPTVAEQRTRVDAPQDGTVVGDAMLELALKPWTGDLPAMLKRRVIRVLVVPNRMYFFYRKFPASRHNL
jgi:uncharacterized membrane protein YphA (DoxX/SURF4 family)